MKQTFRVFVSLTLALMLCLQTVNACTIVIPPLRKDFRKAERVFLGEVLSIENANSDIPQNLKDKAKGLVKFKVLESWKGSNPTEISILSDVGCMGCYTFEYFKVGGKYLLFSEKENFVSYCASREADKDWVEKEMKRLDSFWFRTWARIYPF